MNFDIELSALTDNMIKEDGGESFLAKRNQVTAVLTLMRQGLKSDEREVRIAVLDILAGEAMMRLYGKTIESTNDITEPIALFLIRQLKMPFDHPDPTEKDPWLISTYGRQLLSLAEERAEAAISIS
jgi:hypothetical protein